MITLVADTNFFIQCRPADELDWAALPISDDVKLVVVSTVRQEIDTFKTDGNTRRARRARSAAKLFRNIITGTASPEIYDKGPRVTLSFGPPGLRPSRGVELDLDKPDDRIVGCALALAQEHASLGGPVYVLTQDANLMLTARHEGLHFLEIPDDWLLRDDVDGRDTRIRDLERRLSNLEGRTPNVRCEFRLSGAVAPSHLSMDIPVYVALTESGLDHLLQLARTIHPKRAPGDSLGVKLAVSPTLDQLLTMSSWGLSRVEQPTSEEWERYVASYAKWQDHLHDVLENFHERLPELSAQRILEIVVENAGQAPAEDCLVEIFSDGGALSFLRAANSETEVSLLPPPPKAPEPRRVQLGDIFQALRTTERVAELSTLLAPHSMQTERPAHVFRWQRGSLEDSSESLELVCRQWRHGVEPQRFAFKVMARNVEDNCSGTLRCRITAKNLPSPVVVELPVQVRAVSSSIFNDSKKRLEHELDRAGYLI